MSEPTPRRARHLLDPDKPRTPPNRADQLRLERVQKWVMSVLAVTTLAHLAAGLVISAVYVADDRLDAQIGLNVLAAAFGVCAVTLALAIHRKPLLSPWLLVGLLPGVLGLWLTLR